VEVSELSKSNLMNTFGNFDIIFDYGVGCRLYDAEGDEYLDFVSGDAANCLGHCHPAIIKTLAYQSNNLMHISNYYSNSKAIELVELLCAYSDHDKVFLCNSGTESVEAALKLSRKYGFIKGGENKNKIIYMENSCHGWTLATLSVTGHEKYRQSVMPCLGQVQSAKLNDVDSIKSLLDENTYAVIIEPIQCEDELEIADKSYLKEVRELCDKYDALLIFDEVDCGMGRTGELFAYRKFKVIPDIICIAKGLGGGFPIGAVLANKKAASAFEFGSFGSTFGGNPLASAIAITVLNELIDGNILGKVEKKGQYFKDRLNELKEKYGFIKEIKGMGLLIGISLSIDAKLVVQECFANNLLVINSGDNIIKLIPPLNVCKDEINEVCDKLDVVFMKFHLDSIN
jgi:acetylornithine/N-succinyldiaminopimelate aminotransferase